MQEVGLPALELGRFEALVPPAVMAEVGRTLAEARERFAGRSLWHVSSTATGGGVAEMLQSVLCYLVEAGIDTHWIVVEGEDEFFVVTKRIHHLLHDRPGDGGGLDGPEREVYESVLARELGPVLGRVRPGDVVFLHDPQTLGLAGPLSDAGAAVVWTCHVGVDRPGEHARTAWRFLLPDALRTGATVFTRPQYVWEGLDSQRVEIVPPCIDAFSPKNQPLAREAVTAILERAGIVGRNGSGEPLYTRQDGTQARVTARADLLEVEPVPPGAPLVTQVSRWDPLKDHTGVMHAFAEHVPAELDAHLVLAGPSPEGVDDDPEGATVFAELHDAWHALPEERRARVHVASLPMDDVDENAAIVNALQRHAAAIVQKSLAEGFGLTVAEAMWKERPVAASRVGGIQDQIEHGRTGLLIDDPADLAALGRALSTLLGERDQAERLARAARESVAERYLVPRYLASQLRLALAVDT